MIGNNYLQCKFLLTFGNLESVDWDYRSEILDQADPILTPSYAMPKCLPLMVGSHDAPSLPNSVSFNF